jgi:hypothetical protein
MLKNKTISALLTPQCYLNGFVYGKERPLAKVGGVDYVLRCLLGGGFNGYPTGNKKPYQLTLVGFFRRPFQRILALMAYTTSCS